MWVKLLVGRRLLLFHLQSVASVAIQMTPDKMQEVEMKGLAAGGWITNSTNWLNFAFSNIHGVWSIIKSFSCK